METIAYTREASAATRWAIARLIGLRKFGHTHRQIGNCLCCDVRFGDCHRTSDTDLWKAIEWSSSFEGWYVRNNKNVAFYVDSPEYRKWKSDSESRML